VIPSNFACLDLTRLARGLAGHIREGPAKGPSGMVANYAESDVGIPITRCSFSLSLSIADAQSRVSNFFLLIWAERRERVLRRCRHPRALIPRKKRRCTLSIGSAVRLQKHVGILAGGLATFFRYPRRGRFEWTLKANASPLRRRCLVQPADDACTNKLYGSINRRFGLYCMTLSLSLSLFLSFSG